MEETANDGAGKSIIHKRVDGDLCPVSTVQPVASRMVTESVVYIAVSPASVSMLMERRDPVSPGNTCAVRAESGSDGRFNVAVWVLVIISPFGRDTEMPLFVGQMSRSTAASKRAIKLPVVPVSALIEWVETEDNDCWSAKL